MYTNQYIPVLLNSVISWVGFFFFLMTMVLTNTKTISSMFVFLRVNLLGHRIQFQEKRKSFSSQMVLGFLGLRSFQSHGTLYFLPHMIINKQNFILQRNKETGN